MRQYEGYFRYRLVFHGRHPAHLLVPIFELITDLEGQVGRWIDHRVEPTASSAVAGVPELVHSYSLEFELDPKRKPEFDEAIRIMPGVRYAIVTKGQKPPKPPSEKRRGREKGDKPK